MFYSQDLFCNRATFFDLITKEVFMLKKIKIKNKKTKTTSAQLSNAADLYVSNGEGGMEYLGPDEGTVGSCVLSSRPATGPPWAW